MKVGELYHIKFPVPVGGVVRRNMETCDVEQVIEISALFFDDVHYRVLAEFSEQARDRGMFMDLTFELNHIMAFSGLGAIIVRQFSVEELPLYVSWWTGVRYEELLR